MSLCGWAGTNTRCVHEGADGVEGTAPSSADGAEVFGPNKEPGVVSIVEEMTVLRKERHLLVVIDGGVTSLEEVGVNEVALEGHIVDSLRQRVLAAIAQWT